MKNKIKTKKKKIPCGAGHAKKKLDDQSQTARLIAHSAQLQTS